MGLRLHDTQVVSCMRQDDTKLPTLASTDFHPETGTHHGTVFLLLFFWFVCGVLCGLFLFVFVFVLVVFLVFGFRFLFSVTMTRD